MQTGSIKISELSPMTSSIALNDFFPLVDSSSMTTFRATISTLSSGMGTVSGSLFASRSLFATSASWASSSISASYALTSSYSSVAGKVNTTGSLGYVPMWYGNTANSNLSTTNTDLKISESRLLVNTVFAAGTDHWDESQNYVDGLTSAVYGVARNKGGIMSPFPIISSTFIGMDQKWWWYDTGSNASRNQYYSGSGDWISVGDGIGNVSDSFNGKWVRVAAFPFSIVGDGFVEQNPTAYNPAYMSEFTGHLRFEALTTVTGTNAHNVIEFQIFNNPYGGSIAVNVIHNDIYGPRIIDKIRVCKSYTSGSLSSEIYDPHAYIDIHIDNLGEDDDYLALKLKSFGTGHIKFVKQPTFGPPPPVNDGSSSLAAGPQRLEFVPNQGSYFWLQDYDSNDECRDAIIAGRRLRIDPRNSTITGSRRAKYALEVSGTLGANGFYNQDQQGKSGTFVAYDPISSNWYYASFSGGILVNSSSAGLDSPANNVSIYGNIPIGGMIDYAGTASATLQDLGFYECDGTWYDKSSFPDAWLALGGNNNPWGTDGTDGSGWNSGTSQFRVPDLRKKTTVGAYTGGSDTNYKHSVGANGGDEDFMEKHYHYFGTRYEMTDNNDNIILQWADRNVTSTGHASSTLMDPSKMVKSGYTYWFQFAGDDSSGTSAVKRSPLFRDFSNSRSWDFVTSYPYNEGGNGQLVPPYAIVTKLIRLI